MFKRLLSIEHCTGNQAHVVWDPYHHLLAVTNIPSFRPQFPHLKNEGEHLLHSRCSAKEGLPSQPPPSSPAFREARVRDRGNGSYPGSVSSFSCSLLPHSDPGTNWGGGGGTFVCVLRVGWGVLLLERKMTHWAMGQAPWERPGQPQARAPGS